jgi:hypothetical protein
LRKTRAARLRRENTPYLLELRLVPSGGMSHPSVGTCSIAATVSSLCCSLHPVQAGRTTATRAFSKRSADAPPWPGLPKVCSGYCHSLLRAGANSRPAATSYTPGWSEAPASLEFQDEAAHHRIFPACLVAREIWVGLVGLGSREQVVIAFAVAISVIRWGPEQHVVEQKLDHGV